MERGGTNIADLPRFSMCPHFKGGSFTGRTQTNQFQAQKLSCGDWKKQTNKQTKTKKKENTVICELMMKRYKVDRVAFEIDRIAHQKVMKIVNLAIFSFQQIF